MSLPYPIPTVYAEAYRRTAFYEGGYTKDPHDHGGATKYGCSLRYLKSLGQLGDLDHDGDVDQDDIEALKPEDAIGFFYDSFWVPIGCSRIYSEHLQIKLFDSAVNAGPKRAMMWLQHAVNLWSPASPSVVAEDGAMGAATAAAINSRPDHELLMLMRGVQAQFYLALVKQDPTQEGFKLGWLRRAAT